MNKEKNCGNCRFWVKQKMNGQCRRYPPTGCGSLVPTKAGISLSPKQQQMTLSPLQFTVCPATTEDYWCGDFEPKEKE